MWGRRLALWALAKDYGKDIAYSGPLYEKAQFDGNEVIIFFRETADGLMVARKNNVWEAAKETTAPLRGFQICGDDRKWVWANAHIIDKNSIKVWEHISRFSGSRPYMRGPPTPKNAIYITQKGFRPAPSGQTHGKFTRKQSDQQHKLQKYQNITFF